MMREKNLYIGLMSGTSLDGVDGVLADCGSVPNVCAAVHLDFPPELRAELLNLQCSGSDELERAAQVGNALARCYAQAVGKLLALTGTDAQRVCAIGAHGQTVRHRPEQGWTIQLNAPALLAELTGIDVVADFRARDIAAGGQGAPLVSAFHHAIFARSGMCRAVLNLGGIANISVLAADGGVSGFDTGPGNVLMDGWIARHQGLSYDADGAWAASGAVDAALLQSLLAEPYFAQPAPKSTGRDLFDMVWLEAKLRGFEALTPADVQATLAQLTAHAVADALAPHGVTELFVCGGGAKNGCLMALLAQLTAVPVQTTGALGVPVEQVEALAFAWLAQRCIARQPGNLPAVTGAAGLRVLGAIYPA